MNGNKWVSITVADNKASSAITANGDLLPCAPAPFLLARNDITVGATGQAGVQGDVQVPEVEHKAAIVFQSFRLWAFTLVDVLILAIQWV